MSTSNLGHGGFATCRTPIDDLPGPGVGSAQPISRLCETVDASPGNLRPRRRADRTGAELEANSAEAVRSHRLVTLTGVGGVGKTRLAIEVAADGQEFPDGVWVIELAAITDPATVPDAVAGVLGITQQPGQECHESIADYVGGPTRLLVFDNCEHVLDAAAD